MAARGTRRPHPRRVYKRPVKISGGGKQTGGSCTMAIPRLALAVARVLSVEWHVRGAAYQDFITPKPRRRRRAAA